MEGSRTVMSLQSKLFKGDQRLEACLVQDSPHVLTGVAGDYVLKIQKALSILDGADIGSLWWPPLAPALQRRGTRSILRITWHNWFPKWQRTNLIRGRIGK